MLDVNPGFALAMGWEILGKAQTKVREMLGGAHAAALGLGSSVAPLLKIRAVVVVTI